MATPRKTKAKTTLTSKDSPKRSKAKAVSQKKTTRKAKASARSKAGVETREKAPSIAPKPEKATSDKKATSKKKVGRAPATARPVSARDRPAKSAVDPELQKKIREALVHQRRLLLSLVQSTQAQMAEKSGDLADVSDRASEGYGDELAVGLMAIEAAQLDEIEAAIRRIDEGTYGRCLDCGKPIPRRRLEVLPFAHRCLACKGKSERTMPTLEHLSDEDDNG
ncbi:MAG: TraR/DksA C4-type zinc finger protein [Phycisphaerae bacterium]|nr:TraR/DksA C4-type zinc finger protein [Phycisphaerae bacterium]